MYHGRPGHEVVRFRFDYMGETPMLHTTETAVILYSGRLDV
jgi:hypothetical protein